MSVVASTHTTNQWKFGNDQWYAEFIRATVFLPDPIKIQTVEAWWEACVQSTPDEIARKPSVAQATISGSTPDKSYGCLLACMPDRVDWNLLKTTTPESKYADRPFDIGPVEDAVASFLQILERWAGLKNGPYSRIAFGAVLHLPVASKEISYKKLSEMLQTVKIDPENSSEFLYRINRPVSAKLSGLEANVNRLASWSSLGAYPLSLALAPVTQLQIPTSSPAPYNAVRIELDINTKPANGFSIKDANFLESLSQLIEFGRILASEGDKV